jgi:hypothetical protein
MDGWGRGGCEERHRYENKLEKSIIGKTPKKRQSRWVDG